MFATLHSSLHWLAEVVGVNQNIQVPNKDKIHHINHYIFSQCSLKNNTKVQGTHRRNAVTTATKFNCKYMKTIQVVYCWWLEQSM